MNIDELPTRARQLIASMTGADPSAILVRCQAPGCSASGQLGDMFSLALVYRMPGNNVPPYQCPDEQHYGCTHEHALLAALDCMMSCIEQGDHAEKKDQYEDSLLSDLKASLEGRVKS